MFFVVLLKPPDIAPSGAQPRSQGLYFSRPVSLSLAHHSRGTFPRCDPSMKESYDLTFRQIKNKTENVGSIVSPTDCK